MTRALFAILVLAIVALAIHWRADTHPLLIDAACSSPKLPNPCATTDCEGQFRKREAVRIA